MKGLLFCFAASLQTNNVDRDADAAFNSWCSDAGILCPGAEVRTTPESVAGRGVFSTHDLIDEEVIISIPLYAALTQDNAARYFPTLGRKLTKRRAKGSRLGRIWSRIRRRPAPGVQGAEDCWQAELSAYAMQALDADHPWATWISQWRRDDPMQTLVDSDPSTWWCDDEPNTAGAGFREIAPLIPECKIGAAVGMRLEELDRYLERYEDEVPTSASMYATMTSRAVGLSDSVTAILPMHDMINHSTDPNVALAFAQDETFKLYALRDIQKDEELFISYSEVTDDEGNWDEDKAAWLLVQWGIPSSPPQCLSVDEKAPQMREMSISSG